MQRHTPLSEEAKALLKRPLPNVRTVARNLIRKYGKPEFQLLIQMFQDGAPTRHVMHTFQVTRQRVHQWREILGTQVVTFDPKPEIADLLTRPEPRGTRRVSA